MLTSKRGWGKKERHGKLRFWPYHRPSTSIMVKDVSSIERISICDSTHEVVENFPSSGSTMSSNLSLDTEWTAGPHTLCSWYVSIFICRTYFNMWFFFSFLYSIPFGASGRVLEPMTEACGGRQATPSTSHPSALQTEMGKHHWYINVNETIKDSFSIRPCWLFRHVSVSRAARGSWRAQLCSVANGAGAAQRRRKWSSGRSWGYWWDAAAGGEEDEPLDGEASPVSTAALCQLHLQWQMAWREQQCEPNSKEMLLGWNHLRFPDEFLRMKRRLHRRCLKLFCLHSVCSDRELTAWAEEQEGSVAEEEQEQEEEVVLR